MKRGQMQAMEPVFIVIILVVIVAIALFFYINIIEGEAQTIGVTLDNKETLAILQRASSMPELSCALSETQGTYCIDMYKAIFFSRLMAEETVRLTYLPLFGFSNITITTIPLDGTDPVEIALYSSAQGSEIKTTRTYFTMHDPVTDERAFAVMTIERESR